MAASNDSTGVLFVSQAVALPSDLATADLTSLFPDAVNVSATASLLAVPVQVAATVDGTVLYVTSSGLLVEAQVRVYIGGSKASDRAIVFAEERPAHWRPESSLGTK